MLLVLFFLQLSVPDLGMAVGVTYLVLAVLGIIWSRRSVIPLFTGVRDFLNEAEAAKASAETEKPVVGPAD